MRQPCDEALMLTGPLGAPCAERSRPWVLAATILGSSMAFIDSTVVNVALPALQADLHATVVDLQWVAESYGLFLSALILVGGALGDSLGRRAMFLLGVTAFAAASAGCGLSRSVGSLLMWRSVQGFAAAFLVPGSLAIISASFGEHNRGKAIGTWSGFTSITSAVGPVLGGWLIEHASWHWVFFINVPIAAIVVALTLRYIPESRNPQAGRTPDWTGAALAIAGLGGVVFGLIESSNRGWKDPAVIATLPLGIVALAAFVVVDSQTSAAASCQFVSGT